MSKLSEYNKATKICNIIIEKKEFNTSLSNIIKEYTKENEILITNEICKILAKKGYTIVSINPLKIEH